MAINNGKHQILTGNTILDKLLNQLSQSDREFVLRLMTELGIPTNDPMHPFLVALQYYVSILRDIPASLKSSADESFRKAAQVYGSIQSNIENSVAEIDEIRQQWKEDAEALLPSFRTAFDIAFTKAKEDADSILRLKVKAYEKEIDRINEEALDRWQDSFSDARNRYLGDVLKQGLIWASGAIVITSLAVGGAAYWFGVQQGQANAVKEFGNQDWYDISRDTINRADNKQRMINCNKDRNPKCTIWMVDPPKQ